MRPLAGRPYEPGINNASRAVGAITGLFSAAAGVIHISAAADHENLPVMLAGFLVVAALQCALAGLLLWRRPSPLLIVAAVSLMLGSVGVWLISRTVGLPFLPDGHMEPIGFKDGVTVLFELAAVPGLLLLLSRDLSRVTLPTPRLGTQALGFAGAAAFILMVPALVLGGGAHHSHDEAVAMGIHSGDGHARGDGELADSGEGGHGHAADGDEGGEGAGAGGGGAGGGGHGDDAGDSHGDGDGGEMLAAALGGSESGHGHSDAGSSGGGTVTGGGLGHADGDDHAEGDAQTPAGGDRHAQRGEGRRGGHGDGDGGHGEGDGGHGDGEGHAPGGGHGDSTKGHGGLGHGGDGHGGGGHDGPGDPGHEEPPDEGDSPAGLAVAYEPAEPGRDGRPPRSSAITVRDGEKKKPVHGGHGGPCNPTPAEQAAAADLQAKTDAALRKYDNNPALAAADGYDVVFTGTSPPNRFWHVFNPEFVYDTPTNTPMPSAVEPDKGEPVILDPNRIESFMYAMTDQGLIAIGGMYMMPAEYNEAEGDLLLPRDPKKGPEIGGCLTRWHDHPDLGKATNRSGAPTPEMLHVWTYPGLEPYEEYESREFAYMWTAGSLIPQVENPFGPAKLAEMVIDSLKPPQG